MIYINQHNKQQQKTSKNFDKMNIFGSITNVN